MIDLSEITNREIRMPIMLSEEDANCIIALFESKSGRSDLEDDLLKDFKIFRVKNFRGIVIP